jgi:dipeptidyl aminopeptidase/acylaminoacyl peptidase
MNGLHIVRLALLSLACFLINTSLLQAERMTPELLWKLGRLSGGELSPDGRQVAYSVRHYDLAKNTGTSALHVLSLDNPQDRVVLENIKSISSVQWVQQDDELRLFFIAQFAEPADQKPQVWSVAAGGGTPRQVTKIPSGAANLKVSPTGTWLAFTVDIKLDPTVNEIHTDLPLADARLIDGLMYRHWNAWHDYSYSHLHVAPLNADGTAGEAFDLLRNMRADCPLPPFGGEEQFDWSPDGRELALTLKLVNNWAESTDSDIYLVSLMEPEARRCITHGRDGYDNDPVYSPDGKWIAFHSMERPGFEADRNRILLYDRSSGAIRELTEGLDQTAHHGRWAPDSQSMLFTSEYRGTDQIFRVRLAHAGAEQISEGRFNFRLCGVTPDGQSLLAARQNMLRPEELVVINESTRDGQVVSQINDTHYASLELPTIKERWVRASDGQMIHNWVVYPPDFDEDKTWPMLTYCQGGPQGQIGQWFSFRWNFHLMASNGYVVLAVNRRGLPGFGQAWNDQISGDWGGQAMQDILAATDELSSQSYIDRQRMGAVGASFGGYTVYWLMGNHADRFRCMISHCGVFNLESMYGSTEELFFVNYDLGGPYWKSAAIRRAYEEFSPHRYAGQWKTPLLVIHGEKDFRVPLTQGMEAFTAAQVQGVPSRFLYFPNEGHWVSSPQNSVLWHRVFFDWLNRYCGSAQ